MSTTDLISKTIFFVKQQLKDSEGGHDWFHIERVYKNALLISKSEVCNKIVVQLGALLHDIADSKFHNGDETIGPKVARDFLVAENVSEEIITHVIKIIENISYKGGNFTKSFHSKELEIVQDADRLDAIGAIGIARAFNYGGFKNRIKEEGTYYERHHIVPKSMGGEDTEENLIYLTAREHFIAHWLLWRIHRNKEMAFAFLFMCKYRSANRTLTFSSIAYEEAKISQSKFMSIIHKGKLVSDITREKISKYKKGKTGIKHTDESRRKISESQKGRAIGDKWKEKLRIASNNSWSSDNRKKREDYSKSEATKKKMSESRKGDNNPYKGKQLKFVDPLGNEYIVTGQVKFCKDHNINTNKISQILNNRRENDCDGWKVFKV